MRVLINRQDAIDALTKNKEMINAVLDSLTLDYNTRRDQEQRRGQINEDIETIKALPSAQPEPCDDPRADVYYLADKIGIHRLYALVAELRGEPEPCKDAVSRADVLECFADLYDTFEDCSKGIINELHRKFEDLRTLPSVTLKAEQPEIIYCKDCKHYKAYEYTGRLACHYVIGGTVVRNPNDYCSRAERITDGRD